MDVGFKGGGRARSLLRGCSSRVVGGLLFKGGGSAKVFIFCPSVVLHGAWAPPSQTPEEIGHIEVKYFKQMP